MSRYKEAAERGDAEAQYQLGRSYLAGDNGVAKDDKESEKWYRKAADQGHPVALGVCYQNGWGVTEDLDEAAKWYRKSAEQGNANGQVHLGVCYQKGWGVTKDLNEAVKCYRKAADQGNAGAQYNLGICYQTGEGVTKNLNKAAKWYHKSADQGNARAQLRLGLCYHNGEGVTQNLDEAVIWHRKSAEQGNADAQNNLGICYGNGEGVAKDLNEAAKWYRLAADQGHADAQLNLGVCFQNGQGVTEDLDEAVTWYRKSAEQGDASAQSYLGWCYHNGLGVAKDLNEALIWYRKSADQGNALAQINIGICHPNGWGVTEDVSEAFKLFRKFADQGNADAQHVLALCYAMGEGVTKDLCEAVKWYRKAAAQGHARAQFNLGNCYADGLGVIKDLNETGKWYRKSAGEGDADAQFKLGNCYENGWGVTKDLNEAVTWYRKSADQGNKYAELQLTIVEAQLQMRNKAERGDAEAQYLLGNGCFNGNNGVSKDLKEAVKWYRKSAEQGNAYGQFKLGVCYKNGWGVTKDLNEAAEWYRKSADQGNSDAQFNLGGCYQNGKGVTKDLNEAAKWYRKSAEQGDANAQHNLGRCYEKGDGVTTDLTQAVTWYLKATEQGNKKAFNNIQKLAWQDNQAAQMAVAACYENGLGVTKDLTEAIKWYLKSFGRGNERAFGIIKSLCLKEEALNRIAELAKQSDIDAQIIVGCCYQTGLGVTLDLTEAIKWYQKADEPRSIFETFNAERAPINGSAFDFLYSLARRDKKGAFVIISELAQQNDQQAQITIGKCNEKGFCTAKNLNEAVQWYRKAADQGSQDAFLLLYSLAKQGNKDAFSTISELVSAGNSFGYYYVGECCENGWGTDRDIDQSVKWYHKAAEGGSEEALEKLKSLGGTSNREARMAILDLANQGNTKAASILEQLVQKDSKGMVVIIRKGFTHQLNHHQETKENLHQANQKISQLKRGITSSLKLSLSHSNVQDVDGNTPLMNNFLHLESDILAEPEVSDLMKAAFNVSPWHAVNREERSLAEISLDDRVPAVIRDHARTVMEATLADPSADPALRSAAARALQYHEPLIPPNSSYFDIPFSNLCICASDSSDMPRMQELITATGESARRLPQDTLDQLESLFDMLHSVNKPEMRNISRLERHVPDLEKRLLAIKETHRWLTEYGSIQASESVETDTLERIQDHRDLLERQWREIEPIFAEVNAILPELAANLSSLFPQIEGRADRISPTQLDDVLIFFRNHFGNIAWHQQSVVSASQTLMEALKNYARSVRSVQGDLDIHHSFMKFFLAHVGKVCSDLIPTARRQVEEIAAIRSEFRSKSYIRQLVE